MIIKTPYLAIGGTDLTDQVMQVAFAAEKEAVDSTTSGSDAAKQNEKGLYSGTVEITLKDDFSVGAVDQVLWAAFQADAAVPYEIRSQNAAVSVTNPKWTGDLHVTEYKALGEIGTLAQKELSFPQDGLAVRATS